MFAQRLPEHWNKVDTKAHELQAGLINFKVPNSRPNNTKHAKLNSRNFNTLPQNSNCLCSCLIDPSIDWLIGCLFEDVWGIEFLVMQRPQAYIKPSNSSIMLPATLQAPITLHNTSITTIRLWTVPQASMSLCRPCASVSLLTVPWLCRIFPMDRIAYIWYLDSCK